jgi:hypothetical protein
MIRSISYSRWRRMAMPTLIGISGRITASSSAKAPGTTS